MPATTTAKLIFIEKGPSGTEVHIQDACLLGSGAGNDFVFDAAEKTVSERHATIRLSQGRYTVRDERSTSGTFVNGRRIEEQELEGGDVLEFGLGGPMARFEEIASSAGQSDDGKRTAQRLMLHAQRRAAQRAHAPKRRTVRGTAAVGLLALVVATALWVAVDASRSRDDVVVESLAEAPVPEAASGVAGLPSELDELVGLYVRSGQDTQLAESLEVRFMELAREQASELRAVEEDDRFGVDVTRRLSVGVALISVVWAPDEPKERGGSVRGAGFLLDSEGWIVTNRSTVMPRPRVGATEDGSTARESTADQILAPRASELMAYFPPGSAVFRLSVVALSEDADLALLRTVDGPVDAPPLQLAPPEVALDVGSAVVAMGHPADAAGLLARLPPAESAELLRELIDRDGVSYEATPWLLGRDLAEEMAQRRFLLPMVSFGSIEEIGESYVSSTFAGGMTFRGGPLFGPERRVVAVGAWDPPQSAMVTTGNVLGIPVREVWRILPEDVRERLTAR